jgi:hypothetical protein
VAFEHQAEARRKQDVGVLGAFEGENTWDLELFSDRHVEGARENQLRFQVRLDPKRESRKSSGSPPDAETWFASVVGQIKPLQGHSDPIADVREVASMEGRDSGMWMDQLNGSIDLGDTAFSLGYIPLTMATMVAGVLDSYDCRRAQRFFMEEQLAGLNAWIGVKPTMYGAVE